MHEIRDEAVDPRGDRSRRRPRVGEPGRRSVHSATPQLRRFPGADPRIQSRPPAGSPRPAGERPPARMRGLPPGLRRPRGCHARARARRAASTIPCAGPSPPPCWPPPGSPSGSPIDQYGSRTGRAIVQAVNGTLYEILPTGIRSWPPARNCRTASKSAPPRIPTPCCKLKDGSVVELRERSGFSTTQSRQRSHHPPGPRQHHRAGRQAQFRPPLCGDRGLPRRRHRHRVQRDQRREGLARVRGRRRSPRLPGQPGKGAAPRRSDRHQPQPRAGRP